MKLSPKLLVPLLALLALPAALGTGRVAAHLATVEGELLARDVSHLSPAQRAARAGHIRVLREYREAGVFPHNHDVAGARVPVFVDRHGTHCAVAHLLARSGRNDIVRRVSASRNLARIPELANDPALVAWLDSAGISLAEAARIQPGYDGVGVIVDDEDEVSTGYAVASALSLGFGGISVVPNLGPAPRRIDGIYGLLIGAYGVALGVPKLDDDGAALTLGVLNTAVGAGAAALGARTLWRDGRDDRAEVGVPGGRTVSVAAGPAATPGGTGMGIYLRMTF